MQRGGGRSNLKTYGLIMGVIALAVAVVAALAILDQARNTSSPASPALSEVSLDKSTGPAEAAVVVVEYGDFQCPHCRDFAVEVVPRLKEDYVDTGQVRFAFRHFAFIGAESLWAAEAAECANEQDYFWDYYERLFAEQAGENEGAFSKDNLKGFAADLELDMMQFNQCLDTGKYEARVQQETNEGQQGGVRGIPALFVNGQLLRNGNDYQTLQTAIAAALGRS
jgi:protein-disulfide isomerase